MNQHKKISIRSDAQATIEFAILDALSTTYSTTDMAQMVRAIRKNLFSLNLRWAIRDYLQEIEEQGGDSYGND